MSKFNYTEYRYDKLGMGKEDKFKNTLTPVIVIIIFKNGTYYYDRSFRIEDSDDIYEKIIDKESTSMSIMGNLTNVDSLGFATYRSNSGNYVRYRLDDVSVFHVVYNDDDVKKILDAYKSSRST